MSQWWRSIEELDEVQRNIVREPRDASMLITGRPGSGKTNLLALRGGYLHMAGIRDIVLLTYGRTIKEFIAAGAEYYRFPANLVRTYMSWATEMLRSARIVIPGQQNMPFDQLIETVTREVVSGARGGAFERKEAILLDEVQDYPPELASVLSLLADRVIASGDDNQRIFTPVGDLNDFAATAKLRRFDLPYHYRNGIEIARVASRIARDPEYLATARYDETRLPSSVSLFGDQPIAVQLDAAIENVRNLIESYPQDHVGVLVPTKAQLRRVKRAFEASDLDQQCVVQSFEEGYRPFDPDHRIVLSTIHSAKGVEFRAVELLAFDAIRAFPNDVKRQIAYTAVTRAQTSLTVRWSGGLPAWLREALEGPTQETDINLEDVFA